jgi:hypothetical protein
MAKAKAHKFFLIIYVFTKKILSIKTIYLSIYLELEGVPGFIDSIAGDLTVEMDTVIPTLSFDGKYSLYWRKVNA